VARKGTPKYDHKAISASFHARPPEGAEARTRTQKWLAVPENVERLLEDVSGGLSVRRICEQQGITYAPVQRFLTSDEMQARYYEAQEQHAEHLLGEMERITRAIEEGTVDPKAGAVIMDSLKWRITKLNARRYSDKQVIEQHQYDHTKMHLEAVRQLARRPIEARLVQDTGRLPRLSTERTASLVMHQDASVPTVAPDGVDAAYEPVEQQEATGSTDPTVPAEGTVPAERTVVPR
jgi:hypothetical protein